jgi:hypothetical protein
MSGPLILLFLGIILAVVAIYLRAFERPGAVPTFVVSAVAFLSGLASLVYQHKREQESPPPLITAPAEPAIYRETACGIELPVVQRVMHAVETLEGRLKEHNWDIDRGVCQEYRDQGKRLEQEGDLRGAFREDCRAMLMLMEAINKQRNKEESFKPLWDKAPV